MSTAAPPFFGVPHFSLIEKSRFFGTVTGESEVGGLVGVLGDYSTIHQSYVQGSVFGDFAVGGLVGVGQGQASLIESYAATNVGGLEAVGSVVGSIENDFLVDMVHWDSDLCTASFSCGDHDCIGASGHPTWQMFLQSTYEGWDFSCIWGIMEGEGYPFFIFPEASPADLNCDGVVNVDDLLIVLNNWGPCADCDDCVGDLTGDCTVNIDDLLIVLNNWG